MSAGTTGPIQLSSSWAAVYTVGATAANLILEAIGGPAEFAIGAAPASNFSHHLEPRVPVSLFSGVALASGTVIYARASGGATGITLVISNSA